MQLRVYISLFATAVVASLAACSKSNDDSQISQGGSVMPVTVAQLSSKPAPPAPSPHKPVDLKSTKLDVSTEINGHDAKKIALALDLLDVSQAKYENDAVYKKRMQELSAKPLYDELKVADVIAFKPMNVQYSYDANKQQWKYEISPHLIKGEFNHFLLDERTIPTENYLTDAFNGKRIDSYKTITLKAPEIKGLSYIQGDVKVSPELAPQLESQLGVLIIGKVIPNYLYKKRVLPLEYKDTRYEEVQIVNFKISSIWFVNERTGEVLSKKWMQKAL